MEEIRAFSEEHVRDVANLYLSAARGEFRPAPPALEDAFRECFLGNPWVSPEISPLVYMEKGRLVGFLGVMRFAPRQSQCGWWITSSIAVWRA
jgi:hypothetical protein